MTYVLLLLFREFVNWQILGGPLFVMSKEERLTVAHVIMWHQRYFKVNNMMKVSISGVLESLPMNLW